MIRETLAQRWEARPVLLRPASEDAGVPDVVLQLTAIILLLRPLEVWWVAGFVLLGAALSLLYPSVRRTPLTWLSLSVLVAARIVQVWPLSDNHIYLLAYWCLAIGIALTTETPSVTLAASSRWLLGAAFAFAVLWKAVLSPDYLDGRFFRVTMLTDDRFADALLLIGGMTADQVRDARAFLQPLPEGAELADPVWLGEPPRARAFAAVVTWGGLLVEAFVAALCLVPAVRGVVTARHAALLLFCATTYALAPVAGFGWLVAVMGLAQCRGDQPAVRAAYVAVFFLILLYAEIPWAGVVSDWFDRSHPVAAQEVSASAVQLE
jgi:hypothetical protein